MVPHLAGNAGPLFRLVGAEKGFRRVSAIVQGNECEGLAVAEKANEILRRLGRSSGEFTSPNGRVKPPLHQTDPLPKCAGPWQCSLKLCEKKTRPAWGSGPGNGRNLETFGCYLFFFAFFFAGMFSPSSVWLSLRFAVDGQELWPTKLTPQYVVACGPFVKRNLHFLFVRAKTRAGVLGGRRRADSCLAFREAGPTWKAAARGVVVTS
jgi:hypothetical protein